MKCRKNKPFKRKSKLESFPVNHRNTDEKFINLINLLHADEKFESFFKNGGNFDEKAMIDYQKLIDFFKNVDPKKLAGIAGGIVVLGIILLSFTFILPILAIVAALLLIAAVIFVVYKAIGGK